MKPSCFPACVCLTLVAIPVWAAAPDLFPTDSRRWSRASDAVVLTDFAKAEPATALITGKREKGKWKAVPFATAEWKGMALSAYGGTSPPAVRLPLTERGWHAVYVGLATTSGGFKIGGNGLKARLSDEPVFKRMANNLALRENRRAVIQECYLTVAELKGQSVEIAPLPGLPATICYLKLVPLTEAEVEARSQSRLRLPRALPSPRSTATVGSGRFADHGGGAGGGVSRL